MFGFLIGTASLIGLIAVLRRGRRWHQLRHGAGACGGGAACDGDRDRGHGRSGRGGWRGPLDFLFSRLDTSPGQEKAVRAAAEDVVGELKELRHKLRSSRADVAGAMRAETFDEATLRAAIEQHDGAIARLRESIIAALGKVHDALDAKQRAALADLVADGPGWGFGRGAPYRG